MPPREQAVAPGRCGSRPWHVTLLTWTNGSGTTAPACRATGALRSRGPPRVRKLRPSADPEPDDGVVDRYRQPGAQRRGTRPGSAAPTRGPSRPSPTRARPSSRPTAGPRWPPRAGRRSRPTAWAGAPRPPSGGRTGAALAADHRVALHHRHARLALHHRGVADRRQPRRRPARLHADTAARHLRCRMADPARHHGRDSAAAQPGLAAAGRHPTRLAAKPRHPAVLAARPQHHAVVATRPRHSTGLAAKRPNHAELAAGPRCCTDPELAAKRRQPTDLAAVHRAFVRAAAGPTDPSAADTPAADTPAADRCLTVVAAADRTDRRSVVAAADRTDRRPVVADVRPRRHLSRAGAAALAEHARVVRSAAGLAA